MTMRIGRHRLDLVQLLALLAVAGAVVAGVLAFLEVRQSSVPRMAEPWRAEALATPAGSQATAAPQGGRIEEDGSVTILKVPQTEGRPETFVVGTGGWSNRAQPFEPVPNAMLGGIRALFRLIPEPPEPGDELVTVNLDRRTTEGRLMLVRGCLRFDAPNGPLVVLPPGSVLGLRQGYLTVGPPGLPPARSARIGERIFWEDELRTRFDAATRRRVTDRCGPGPLAYVLPWSASVQKVDQDSFRAEEVARERDLTWREAYEEVRRCGEEARVVFARENRQREPQTFIEICHMDHPTTPNDPGNCPLGTRWEKGNCLDRRGQVVPVPPPPPVSR
jgi:hypothetical protein